MRRRAWFPGPVPRFVCHALKSRFPLVEGELMAEETIEISFSPDGSVVNVLEQGPLQGKWHEPLVALSPSVSTGLRHVQRKPPYVARAAHLRRTADGAPGLVAQHRETPLHLAWVARIPGGHDSRPLPPGPLLPVPSTRDSDLPADVVSQRVALTARSLPPRGAQLSPKGEAPALAGQHGTLALYPLTMLTLGPVIARTQGTPGARRPGPRDLRTGDPCPGRQDPAEARIDSVPAWGSRSGTTSGPARRA